MSAKFPIATTDPAYRNYSRVSLVACLSFMGHSRVGEGLDECGSPAEIWRGFQRLLVIVRREGEKEEAPWGISLSLFLSIWVDNSYSNGAVKSSDSIHTWASSFFIGRTRRRKIHCLSLGPQPKMTVHVLRPTTPRKKGTPKNRLNGNCLCVIAFFLDERGSQWWEQHRWQYVVWKEIES